MPLHTVEQVLKFTTDIDAVAALASYDKLVRLNDESMAKLREAQRQLQGDIESYASTGARNVAQYMRDSVRDQLDSLARYRREVVAFGDDMMRIEAQMRTGARFGELTEEDQNRYLVGLRAREALYGEHVKRQTAIHEEEERRRAELTGKIRSGIAGGLALGTQIATRDNSGSQQESFKNVASGLQSIASSKTIWQGMFNTLHMLVTLAQDWIAEDKRRIQSQITIGGGSQFLGRYATDVNARAQANRIFEQLKSSSELTESERSEGKLTAALAAIQQRGQGSVDVGTDQFKRAFLDLAPIAARLGRDLSEFGGTVADLSRRTGQTFTQVTESFAEAGRLIELHNQKSPHAILSQIEFVNQTQQLTEALKEQRYAFRDVTAITFKWREELDRGTISIQEIAAAMKGMRTSDAGMLAFIGNKFAELFQKNIAGQLPKEITDKLAGALSRESAVGKGEFARLAADAERSRSFFRERGVDLTIEQAQTLARQAQRDRFAAAGAMVDRSLARNATPLEREFMQRQLTEQIFGGSTGLNLAGRPRDFVDRIRREGLLPDSEEFGRFGRLRGPGGAPIERLDINADVKTTAKEVTKLRESSESFFGKILRSTWGRLRVQEAEGFEQEQRKRERANEAWRRATGQEVDKLPPMSIPGDVVSAVVGKVAASQSAAAAAAAAQGAAAKTVKVVVESRPVEHRVSTDRGTKVEQERQVIQQRVHQTGGGDDDLSSTFGLASEP